MIPFQQMQRATLACLLGLLVGCNPATNTATDGTGGSEATGNAALVRVTPVSPVRTTLVRRTEQPGHVEAFEETPLYAKVAGYVAAIHVDIGDAITGPKRDDKQNVI